MDLGGISLTFFLGLLLRFGVPIVITTILIIGLTRLDEHWQVEAKAQLTQASMTGLLARNVGCWEINKCPPEKLRTCAAYKNPETPCWQIFRDKSGLLQDRCLLCKVFREAPVPVHG